MASYNAERRNSWALNYEAVDYNLQSTSQQPSSTNEVDSEDESEKGRLLASLVRAPGSHLSGDSSESSSSAISGSSPLSHLAAPADPTLPKPGREEFIHLQRSLEPSSGIASQTSTDKEDNVETELTINPNSAPPLLLSSGTSKLITTSASFGTGLGFPPNAVSRIPRSTSFKTSPLANSPTSSPSNSPPTHFNTSSPSTLVGSSITRPASISAPFPVMAYSHPGNPPFSPTFSPTYSPSAQISPVPSGLPLNSPTSPSIKPGAYRPGPPQPKFSTGDARTIPNSFSNFNAGGNSLLTAAGSRGSMILYRLSATEDGLLPPQLGNPRDRANRASANSASGDSIMSLGADSRRLLINESFVSSSILGSRGGSLSVNEVGHAQGGLVAYAYDPYEDADADELDEEEEEWVRGHAAGYIYSEHEYQKMQPGSGTATPQSLDKKILPVPPPLALKSSAPRLNPAKGPALPPPPPPLFSSFSWRGVVNITTLVVLIVALLSLFVAYPIFKSFSDNGVQSLIIGNTRINATGQATNEIVLKRWEGFQIHRDV